MPFRFKARDRIGAVLTEEQKGKLDEYLHGPHPELHGGLVPAQR